MLINCSKSDVNGQKGTQTKTFSSPSLKVALHPVDRLQLRVSGLMLAGRWTDRNPSADDAVVHGENNPDGSGPDVRARARVSHSTQST